MPVADIVLIGAVPKGKALLRSTARPGHLLYVTGALGGAAAGLSRLAELARHNAGGDVRSGEVSEKPTSGTKARIDSAGYMRGLKTPPPSGASISAASEALPGSPRPPRIPKNLEALLAPHLYPEPRIAQGLWLVRHGLTSAAIDLSDGLSTDLAHLCEESRVAAELDAALLPIHASATLAQALNGGEDYELLFTAPTTTRVPRSIAGAAITRIGCIVKSRPGQAEVTLLTAEGSQPLKPRGWEHFA